ncbi:enolase C-terminal domain-like protein [Streptomyces asiaticus]
MLLSDPRRRTARYLEIATTAGVTGRYGPLDQDVAAPLTEGMASGLLGLNPMANGYIWDVLQRTDRHSRHGTRKMAISAVDNALWDLRGRLLGVPVWQLLGGAGRTHIPAYASTHGTFHSDGEVERTAEELLDEGYTAQKWFFGDGPAQGPEGMERNIALVKRTRAAVGFRSASFAQLRSSTTIPLAAGEHLYDRYDLLPFLRKGLLSVVQVDPEWCGGVTEVVRMCAMAEPFGVQVFPRGHGIHAALHIVVSQSPQLCPSVEYLYRFTPEKHYFEVEAPVPKGGVIPLPTRCRIT